MKLRLLFYFITLFLIQTVTYSQEKIEYFVDDNLLTVSLIDINANCCAGFLADYHINYSGNVITVSVADTSSEKCRCVCDYDLTINIGPLPQGKYNVVVIKEESVKYAYPRDRKFTLGRKDVSIYAPHPKSPLTMEFRQSICKTASHSDFGDEQLKGGVELYPNPSAGAVSIKFNLKESSDVTIKLLNFIGKEIDEVKYPELKSGTNLVHLNLTNIPQGMYIGKIISSSGQMINFKLMWSK